MNERSYHDEAASREEVYSNGVIIRYKNERKMVSFAPVAGISSAIPGIPMHIPRKGIVLKSDRNMS